MLSDCHIEFDKYKIMCYYTNTNEMNNVRSCCSTLIVCVLQLHILFLCSKKTEQVQLPLCPTMYCYILVLTMLLCICCCCFSCFCCSLKFFSFSEINSSTKCKIRSVLFNTNPPFRPSERAGLSYA